MKTKNFGYIFLMVILPAMGMDRETLSIMPFVESSVYCYNCHRDGKMERRPDLTVTCDDNCLTCHVNLKGRHHPTGAAIKGHLPEKMERFIKDRKLSCITCHDLTMNRLSPDCYASQSLFDKLIDRNKAYRTYYLVMRNNDGQLCRKCH